MYCSGVSMPLMRARVSFFAAVRAAFFAAFLSALLLHCFVQRSLS